jgi:hypothetical protein
MSRLAHREPYAPDAKNPWGLKRVLHLHRRAGFAASWDELQRDLKDGPGKCLDRILKGEAKTYTPADFAATAEVFGDAAATAGEINRLRAAWFYRMLFGPDPLGERLALVWHDHFATGNAKVHNVRSSRAAHIDQAAGPQPLPAAATRSGVTRRPTERPSGSARGTRSRPRWRTSRPSARPWIPLAGGGSSERDAQGLDGTPTSPRDF